MGKFNYNNKIYDEFANLDFGKRVYFLIRNENDLKYIYSETIDGQKVYKMPSNNYSLEANQGKSLKQLNERILVEHVLSTLVQNLENIEKNVEKVKQIIKEPKMTLLIKGNLSEITIESFEANKTSMLQCFDNLFGTQNRVDNTINEQITQTLVMKPIRNDYPELSRISKYEEKIESNTEKENTNPLGIRENDLSLNDVDELLGKKEDLSNTQTTYLEELQEKLSSELEKENKPQEEIEKPKVLVKTKKSAFVDIIIVCLGIQLVLFIGLICVMLFIK